MGDYASLLASHSRAYLEHVRRLVGRKDVWAITIEQDEALLEGVRAIDYTREHVSGSRTQADVAEIMDRMERNREQHLANMAELEEVVEDAQRRIGRCSPVHARLLLLRYVSDLPWGEVASRLVYSEDYCRKQLHDAALEEMHAHLPQEWKVPGHRAI